MRIDRDRTLKFSRFMYRRFIDDKCFETAGALSYTTLVSLVPLMVAVLAIISLFPVFVEWRQTLLDYAFQNFLPAAGDKLKDVLQGFADKASQLTGISVLLMLFSALSMMVSIEDRLNLIWRVQTPRSWSSRLLLYWAALTLGPVLVVGGLIATTYVFAMPMLKSATAEISLGRDLLKVVPFVVTFTTLWLLYVLVPNCRVSRRDAAIGALLGAILFEIARAGFAQFISHAPNYTLIYGALAALPILLLWIYLSWVMVILGASVAASISAFEYRPVHGKLSEDAAFIGLLVVLRHFIDAQREGRQLDKASIRQQERYLRSVEVSRYIDDLREAGLIHRCEGAGWALIRSLDSTQLAQVYRHCHYRLPLQPRHEIQTLGIELPEPLLALLDDAAKALDGTLEARLDQLYPSAPPAILSQESA